jgi:uncharacterized protein (TIGR02001 family)
LVAQYFEYLILNYKRELFMKKQTTSIFMLTLLLLLANQSQAQTTTEVPATTSISSNLTFTSQYISRGFRQTWGKPALQGGIDVVHPNGWSAGIWGSSVSDRFVENASIELDFYGGYSRSFGDIGYSVIGYYYTYPGAEYSATSTTYNYGELSLGVNYKTFYAKYNYTITEEFFGITNAKGTGYLDIGANVELATGLTLNLHLGQGRVNGATNQIWNWRDAKIGLSKVLDNGWTLAAAVTKAKGATNIYQSYTLGIPNSAGKIDVSDPSKATFVVSISRSF